MSRLGIPQWGSYGPEVPDGLGSLSVGEPHERSPGHTITELREAQRLTPIEYETIMNPAVDLAA